MSGSIVALELIASAALILTGMFSIFWPLMPKDWKAWEIIGWIFKASTDRSMGIQYMFFWMITLCYALFAIPIGIFLGIFFFGGEK